MKSNFFLYFLKALKLPLKLLTGVLRNKPKRTKTEHERKLLAHVRNFAPAHYSWQKSLDKKKKAVKKKKTNLKKKEQVKTN